MKRLQRQGNDPQAAAMFDVLLVQWTILEELYIGLKEPQDVDLARAEALIHQRLVPVTSCPHPHPLLPPSAAQTNVAHANKISRV